MRRVRLAQAQADLKRAKAIQRAAESGAADATVDKSLTELTDAEIKDKEELTRLEAEGFTDWSRSEVCDLPESHAHSD